jgi:hypothetical protein
VARDLDVSEQMLFRRETERQDAKRRWYAINEWGLMNALASKLSLDNWRLSKETGGEVAMVSSPIPFGNVNNSGNTTSGIGTLAQVAMMALALGGGGLGLASLAGLLDKPEASSPPVVEAVAQEKEIDVFIDWEIVPDE